MLKKFKASETVLAAYALYWGVLLIIPKETFANPAYSAMKTIAPELIWGVFALCIGIFQIYGMLSLHIKTRKLAILIATGFWYFVYTMFMISDPFTTGGTYIILAILSSWVFVKVGEQHGR